MKKYLLVFVMALCMSATFAINRIDGELTGYISDAMCAAKGKANSADHAACAMKCIKGGEAAVLVVGDKVYKISNQKAITKYAGKKVTVEGKITDDSIEVTKVTEVKA